MIMLDVVDRQGRVRFAIEELRASISQTDFRTLYDHWIGGKSFADIAATLGFTPKRARDHNRRVVGKLRALLSTSTRNLTELTPSPSVRGQ